MKKVIIIVLVAFILIQFFQIDKSNPTVNKGTDFLTIKNTPESTAKIIQSSCYDCHSNESIYPWYSYVQPFGWFLQHHIKEGRRELNFSEFATYEPKRQAHKMEESGEQVEKGEMPLESYLLIHQEAKLNDAQKKELVDYFKTIESDIRINNHLPEGESQPQPQKE